jgi:hypothetical protein
LTAEALGRGGGRHEETQKNGQCERSTHC